MLKNFRMFVAGFLTCALLIGSTVGVIAANDIDVKAMLMNSIKLKLYGRDFIPKETDGSNVLPINYKGRNYLPVRHLVEALEIPVDWDNDTKTIWIGGMLKQAPINDSSMYNDSYGTILTEDAAKIASPSFSYKWGITNGKVLDMSYFDCLLIPNNKYSKFKASIYMDSAVKRDLIMEFRKDNKNGEVLKSITLEPGKTTEVEVEIGGVYQFFITSEVKIGHDKVEKLIIGEPVFFNEYPQ